MRAPAILLVYGKASRLQDVNTRIGVTPNDAVAIFRF
ncbi:hypothetical protein PP1Y_AT14047 [Novosphingobium sp. PP1Y]|nr:hypothetical protein PP1Y_AT14047 [Novosphingobium sp. PP1Y]